MTTDKPLPLTVHRMAAWRGGRTGRSYAFWAYELGEPVPAFPGVFLLAAPDRSPEGWRVLYLGETDNFERAVRDCAARIDAERLGATHILLYCQGGQPQARCEAEGDLAATLQPPLNRVPRLAAVA